MTYLEIAAKYFGFAEISARPYDEGPLHKAPDGTTAVADVLTVRSADGRKRLFVTPVEWERVEVEQPALAALLSGPKHRYRVKDVRPYVEQMLAECKAQLSSEPACPK